MESDKMHGISNDKSNSMHWLYMGTPLHMSANLWYYLVDKTGIWKAQAKLLEQISLGA